MKELLDQLTEDELRDVRRRGKRIILRRKVKSYSGLITTIIGAVFLLSGWGVHIATQSDMPLLVLSALLFTGLAFFATSGESDEKVNAHWVDRTQPRQH